MEEQFLPYNLALELKELGFDENCLARFDGGGFRMLPIYDPLKNNEIKEAWFCVTPLWQQAFDWFEDKYSIGTHIYKYDDGEWDYDTYCDIIPEMEYDNEAFKTRYEAREACINKLIEIVKEK